MILSRIHPGWLLAAIVALIAGLITWHAVAMSNWENACYRADGVVEERYEYTMEQVTYVNNVPIFTDVPVYSYHCWVGNTEIDI